MSQDLEVQKVDVSTTMILHDPSKGDQISVAKYNIRVHETFDQESDILEPSKIEEVYRIHKIYMPSYGYRFYAVNYRDQEIFNDLLQITEDSLDEYVKKRLDAQIRLHEAKLNAEVQRIKFLPFWKRLLNLF